MKQALSALPDRFMDDYAPCVCARLSGETFEFDFFFKKLTTHTHALLSFEWGWCLNALLLSPLPPLPTHCLGWGEHMTLPPPPPLLPPQPILASFGARSRWRQ